MTGKVLRQAGEPLFKDFIWQLPPSAAKSRAVVISGTRGNLSSTVSFLEGLSFFGPKVALVLPESMEKDLKNLLPVSIAVAPMPETPSGSLAGAGNGLDGLLEGALAAAFGDISENAESTELIRGLIGTCPAPVILFGDAARQASKNIVMVNERKAETWLTARSSHLAELLHQNIKEIDEREIDAVENTVNNFSAKLIYLRETDVIVAEPGRMVLTPLTTQGAQTAERLAGFFTSMLLTGGESFEAAASACYLFASGDGDLRKVKGVLKSL